MRSSVLQCAAVNCTVLQRVAARYKIVFNSVPHTTFVEQYYSGVDPYKVATISRLPKNIGLFCKRPL